MSNLDKILNFEENHQSLCKADELLTFKRKFDEGIESILEEAKRRHVIIYYN